MATSIQGKDIDTAPNGPYVGINVIWLQCTIHETLSHPYSLPSNGGREQDAHLATKANECIHAWTNVRR